MKLKKYFCAETVLIGFLVIVILIYGCFAYPLYISRRTGMVEETFEAITDMELSAIDQEEEEVLNSYSGERLGITITDSEFRSVYSTYNRENSGGPGKNIRDHLEEYQDPPTVHVNRKSTMTIIRLRGIVHQEQDYYVYIRLEIRAVGEVIRHTTAYFVLAGVLLLAVWYLWGRDKIKSRLQQGQAAGENAAESSGKEQEKREDELAVRMQENLMMVQKSFIADVTHELKTPLAVIAGQVEMLETMGNQIDRAYYFGSIREEIERMSEMISSMLNLTIMEHHMDEMETGEVNLSDLMQYLILKYDALFHQRGIRLQTELAEDCTVSGNQMYLEQAVNNYLMNAFERTAQGKEIRIRLYEEGNHAVVSVYNEGTAVAPEQMELIWQQYYSRPVENSQGVFGKKSAANAGLGLFMVRKIVELHHGSYGVNNVQKGVEFWMRIPCNDVRE